MIKSKWYRKAALTVLLCATITSSLAPKPVLAVPVYTEYTGFVASAESRCIELDEYLAQDTSGQYGLLYDAQMIAEYSMYVKFLYDNASYFGISDNEKKYYKDNLSEYIKDFNKQYNVKSKKFTRLKLKFNGSTTTKLIESIEENLVSVLPGYVDSLCKDLQRSVNNAKTNEEKNSLKKKKGVLLSSIYDLVNVLQETPEEITNLMPYKKDTSNGLVHQEFTVSFKTKGLGSVLDELWKTYATVLSLGMSISEASTNSEGLVIDTSKDWIENLSNAVNSTAGVQIPEKAELKLPYLSILASSSIYIPFKSYAGESEFLKALRSLAKTDEMGLNLVALYSKTKDFKKPLYRRDLDSTGAPTGTASLITIDEFIKEIKDGTAGSLCMVKGNFQFDASKQSWLYQLKDSDFLESTSVNGVLKSEGDLEETSSNADAASSNTTASLSGIIDTIASLNPFIPMEVKASATTSASTEATTEASTESVSEDSSLTFAYKDINDDSRLTEPVLLYGSVYSRDVDNTTTAILNNIFAGVSDFNQIKDSKTAYLYMNAYGDIVTDNNLIILPGICNPLLYKVDSEMNVYSAGIMNNYPAVMKHTSFLQLVNKEDIGKYLFLKNTKDNANNVIGAKLTSLNTIKTTAPLTIKKFNSKFTANNLDSLDLLSDERLIIGNQNNWNKKNQAFYYNPIIIKNNAVVNNKSVFSYVIEEDTSFEIASTIAKNMYNYLAIDNDTSAERNLELLNDNYILHNVLMQGLNGTDNALGFAKNQLLEYDHFVDNASSRIASYVVSFLKPIIEKIGDVDGVIGLKNSYQDKIFGKVFDALRENWIIIVFISLIIFLYTFARMRNDLLKTTVMVLFSTGIAYLFIIVLPVYLPMFFNIVINNVSEVFTYQTLATKSEQEGADELSIELDDDGMYKLNTTSITLYRVGPTQIQQFKEDLGIDSDKASIINQESGLFAEGDSLKVNTSLLFKNLKILGEEKTVNGSNVYHLKSYKTVSDNIDYYVPYYQIVDNFIVKLNTLADIYELPRRTVAFNNNQKENYLVYSYTNSKPFLLPGKYGVYLPEDTTGWTKKDKEAYVDENNEIAEELDNAFGTNIDFLGVSNFLYNLSASEKKTLWAQTMQKNGYYDSNWKVNEEKMDELITYINFQTKKFIFDMEDQIGSISDDVMIKVISLRALIALTQKASEYSTWMYPFSLNYDELKLGDILVSVFCDDYSEYVKSGMDLTEYMTATYGWFNTIIFAIVSILIFLVVYVIRVFVPLTYLLLGIVLIVKLLNQSDVKIPVKGYLKSMLIAMGCFTTLTISVMLANKMNGNVISIYFLLLMVGLILYLLSLLVMALLTNITEFGNSAINVRMNQVLNHLPIKQDFLNVRQMNLGRRNKLSVPKEKNDSIFYGYSNSVEPDRYYDKTSGNTVINNLEEEVVLDDLTIDNNEEFTDVL